MRHCADELQQRVMFYDGDDNLCPGIRLRRTGGLANALVSVHTKRGWLLASDAAHFMKIWTVVVPLPLPIMLARCSRVLRDCAKWQRAASIIPGHDPLVMRLYPAVDGFDGKVAHWTCHRLSNPSTLTRPSRGCSNIHCHNHAIFFLI